MKIPSDENLRWILENFQDVFLTISSIIFRYVLYFFVLKTIYYQNNTNLEHLRLYLSNEYILKRYARFLNVCVSLSTD